MIEFIAKVVKIIFCFFSQNWNGENRKVTSSFVYLFSIYKKIEWRKGAVTRHRLGKGHLLSARG
jgi:hypothetical protein